MSKITSLCCLVMALSTIFVTQSWALEPIVRGIYRNRPAFTEKSYQAAIAFRKNQIARESREKYSAGCPNAQKYVHQIFSRLVKDNSIENLVSGPVNLNIVVMCKHAVTTTVTRAGFIEFAAGDLLLASSDDEVAFVIAHEMSHILLGHDELLAGFSRDLIDVIQQADDAKLDLETMEWEADEAALELIMHSNYNPLAAASIRNKSMISAGACFGMFGKCLIYDKSSAHLAFVERAERMNAIIEEKRLKELPNNYSDLFTEAQRELTELK